MCQYVDGLVVPVEQAEEASLEGLKRSVTPEYVGVELKIRGHVLPGQQLDHIPVGSGTAAAAAGVAGTATRHRCSCSWWMLRCRDYRACC